MAKKKKAPANTKQSPNTGEPARTTREHEKSKSEKISSKIKIEKNTVIVLAIAAVIFFCTIYFIDYKDLMNGTEDVHSGIFTGMEFEKATVTEILKEDVKIDEIADHSYTGSQRLAVTIKSGRLKGETMEVQNYFGPLSGVPVSVGDSVTLTIKTRENGERSATVYEFNRIPFMAGFLVIFFIVIIIIGGRTGLKSLIGLVFTVICLFTILIPLLLKGAPTITTTFITCVFIAVVCFTILGGVHRKTISAFLGTASGALLAMAFGLAVQYLAKIDGYRLEDAEPLLQLKYAGAVIKIRGLLVAGIIISALGAVMDVAMSISSALEEVYSANPSLSRKELFRSGMNIGRDMAGTMTNTLILAFLGSEFTLIIFLYSRGLTFYHLFSTAFVSLETISGLSASIGMALAMPLTAWISSMLITKKKTA